MNEEKVHQTLKALCYGRRNAKKSLELERCLHLSGNELRRLVNHLRSKGVPIGSSRDGYFYAATAAEVYTTIRHLRVMVNGLERAIAGLESALEQYGPDEART